MIIDEEKLRDSLAAFPPSMVDKVVQELHAQGLPVTVKSSGLELGVREDVNIKFNDNHPARRCDWSAKIGDINPLQIKSIRIPELSYEYNDIMTIDLTLYAFKVEPIYFKTEYSSDE